jgi:small subunit ribosomal protein S7
MLSTRHLALRLSSQWTRQASTSSSSSLEKMSKLVEQVVDKPFTQTPPPEPTVLPLLQTKQRSPRELTQIPPESDPTLFLFASCIMKHGERHKATHIVSRMLVHLHAMTRSPPLPIFREAIKRASPSVRMRSQKTGGKIVLKPEALNEKQRTRSAIKAILQASFEREGAKLELRLARELVGILNGQSGALNQKESVHKLAAANRFVLRSVFFLLVFANLLSRSNIGIRV